MKKHRILFFTLCLLAIGSLLAQTDGKQLLCSQYSKEFLNKNLLSKKDFHPFPLSGDTAWTGLPQTVKDQFVKEGEAHLKDSWVAVPAILFTRFRKDGNRGEYEKSLFGRRDVLIRLVIAELVENKGRFLPDIVNGVWTVCEESWWGTSAHYGPNLPDVQRGQDVDLFQAETAGMMSTIRYLFKEKFDSISPLISKRISYEVKRRMLDPCLSQNFWWMGAGMNWNPWITSNWLYCLLLEEEDTQLRSEAMIRIFKTLDSFIDSYAPDGGCDEGPAYWSRAAGSMFDCLHLLSLASQGKINLFDQSKVREMGRFVCKTYIGNRYYVNFADAKPFFTPDLGLVYRYGRAVGDETMMSFSAFQAQESHYLDRLMGAEHRPFLDAMNRILFFLQELNHFQSQLAAEPLERDQWLPGLEVMTARSYANRLDGFFLAAKGGHNAEAHNHNDIGNFILYAEGKPLLIDVGVGTYEKKTFNNERYTIWTMQSSYHNTPTINGVAQKDGHVYSASDVSYKADASSARYTLDVAKAYPKEARVKSWKRSLDFQRRKGLKVTENYQLETYLSPSFVQLMTTATVVQHTAGQVELTIEGRTYLLTFPSSKCELEIDPIEITDPVLIANWGKRIHRLILRVKSKGATGGFQYSISR